MATVGQALTAPESGWQRIDDLNAAISWFGTWTTHTAASCWGGSERQCTVYNSYCRFNFVGTKIRLTAWGFTNRDTGLRITIDGVNYTFTQYTNSSLAQVLCFEKTGLANIEHTVEIRKVLNNSNYFSVDAIDIDSGGSIKAYSTAVNPPVISNPTLTPNSTHNNNVNLSATLNDVDGGTLVYQILLNNVVIYPSGGGWSGSVPVGYILDYNIDNLLFETGGNTVKLNIKDPSSTVTTWSGSVTIANTVPTITITHTESNLQAVVGDLESDLIKYRILINGVQKYPELSYTNFINTPTTIKYAWTSRDINIGIENTITIEAVDNYDGIATGEFQFIGKYNGLMFLDEIGQYYSSDIGDILKALNFGLVLAGEESVERAIRLKNQCGYSVRDIILRITDINVGVGNMVQLSKTDLPFVPETELVYNSVLNSDEEITFYVKILSDIDTLTGGSFRVYTKANPV